MSTNTSRSQESTGTVTGPHDGRGSDGELDHRYWRCERCGLETTDSRLSEGCFRCDEREAGERESDEREGDGRESDEQSPAGSEHDGAEADG